MMGVVLGAVMVNGAGATRYEARLLLLLLLLLLLFRGLAVLVGDGLLRLLSLLLLIAVMVLGELLLTGGGIKVRTPGDIHKTQDI